MIKEGIQRECKNYSQSSGKCMITCHKENVSVGDKCPFQKENEYKCNCFRKAKIEDKINKFLNKE